MVTVLHKLEERNLITRVVGPLPRRPRVGLLVWARSVPKFPFRGLTALAQTIAASPVQVFVDDIFTMLATGRSAAEQEPMNEAYRRFFGELGCEVRFSSDFLGRRHGPNLLKAAAEFSRSIPVPLFIQTLPKHKLTVLPQLDMSELLHGTLELMCLEEVAASVDGLIVGEFSMAIAMLHRDISPKPVTVITAPRIEGGEPGVNQYIETLRRL